MLISNNSWDSSSTPSTPTNKSSLENSSPMPQMHSTKSDIVPSLTLMPPETNPPSKSTSSQTKPQTPLLFKIQELEWPSKNSLPTSEPSLNQELKLSWKLFPKVLISPWLVNSVSDSTQLSSLPIKSLLSPNLLKTNSNGDGNQLLEEHSQLLKMMDLNSPEDQESFFPLNPTMSNFLKKENWKI